MSMRGTGDLWLRLGNYLHYFGIAFTNPKSGPDADIMRIIAASKKCGLYSGPVSILRLNNADIIRIIESVNRVINSLPCGPHTSSISVAVLGFLWYRSSHPDPQNSPQLQIWPHHRSDTASQPSVLFFMLGNRKQSDGAKSGECGGWWTNSKPCTVMHSSHCNHRALSWWNRTPFISFPGRSQNVSSTTFQSPKLLTQWGFIWKEAMQLVSGEVEYNACKISLLWYNCFLVSLWTFQPSLIFHRI